MTLDQHIKTMREIEADEEQAAFDKLAKENGLPPNEGFGSVYQIARYWFSLGWEANERDRE